jgi:osmotically-inducible protein OsmY
MMRAFVVGAALGAGLMYLFDPNGGRRRQAIGRDRTLALFRRGARRGERATRAVSAEVGGFAQDPKEFDDATLADKVRSEVLRDRDMPKGDVIVSAARGVVSLRGEVDGPELIAELVDRTRQVQGVADVENLLHVANTTSAEATSPTLQSGSKSSRWSLRRR